MTRTIIIMIQFAVRAARGLTRDARRIRATCYGEAQQPE
jgi:hypothetical protein